MTDQSRFTSEPASKPPSRAEFDRTAEERGEGEGMVRRKRKAADPSAGSAQDSAAIAARTASEPDSALAAHHRMRPQLTAEDSDLERRVLAHERILQALIAHMAEAEPKFLARLSAVFVDTVQFSRREHAYKDTDAYAEQFIREVVRLGEKPAASPVRRERPRSRLGNVSPQEVAGPRGIAPTLFQVRRRTGIWEVTQDGAFYGDYAGEEHALTAARAAVRAILASGGTAEVIRSTQM